MDGINLSNSIVDFSVVQQNEAIKRWTPKVRRALKSAVRTLDNGKPQSFVVRPGRQEGRLFESITVKTGKQMGVIELISFSFERHGVFVHKGVGRGWVMAGDAVVRTAKGTMLAPRAPFEWFNPVLEDRLPELADTLASINANAALNAAGITIR